MFIIGLGTAVPPYCYKQSEGWTAAQAAHEFHRLTPRSKAILRKVLLSDNGIDTRYLSLRSLHDAFELHPDALHARFADNAPVLGTEAAHHALGAAHVAPHEIDALIISTCTGYLCPGLTSYVAELLDLRPNILALDLVGQGCGAALPNLRTAEMLLRSGHCRRVLSICVEICSAAFYLDNDPGVLISACLFGDGAGAVVLANEPSRLHRRIQWSTSASLHVPSHRDALRFQQKNGMLRNLLTKEVPSIAAQHADTLIADVLGRTGLNREQISGWILHAGGREVLVALREQLGLAESDLASSAAVLRRLGNVSSPCVFFVLAEALANHAPGGYWWMSAFGAGFSCHGAVLQVE